MSHLNSNIKPINLIVNNQSHSINVSTSQVLKNLKLEPKNKMEPIMKYFFIPAFVSEVL